MQQRHLKAAFLAGGVAAAALSLGYLLQQPWATGTYPWAEGRLGNVFAGSILAAVAVPLLWIGVSGRFAATLGGFVHLGVMLGGIAAVLFALAATREDARLQAYAIGLSIGAIACAAMCAWAGCQPLRDGRPLTRAQRGWFILYTVLLVPTGLARLWGVPGIMPWPVKPEASLLYGCVFLSAVCSFAVPLWRPQVEYACVGLWGFLAYDAVLIPAFIAHFPAVRPELKTTLVVYTSVLVLTAWVSVWYLFIARATRIVGATAPRTQSPPAVTAHPAPASHGPNAASP